MTNSQTPIPRTIDQPPANRGTTTQAVRFCTVLVLATLSPLLISLHCFARFFEQPAASDWVEQLDSRTIARANSFSGPRIIFIGGSNVRFGINAPSLSRQVGVPVVNYGLHAGLGIELIAYRGMQLARKGDVIVFAPELAHFRKGVEKEYTANLQLAFLDRHWSPCDRGLSEFPLKQWYVARWRCDLLRSKPEEFARPSYSPPTAYQVATLGPDGSITFPRPRSIDHFEDVLQTMHPSLVSELDLTDSPGVRAISVVQSRCRELGCPFFIMPPFRVDVPAFDPAEAHKFEQKVMQYAVAKGATELLQPGDTVLPPQYGFDTEYHLNDLGVALVEPRLVTALKRAIATTQSHN